MNESVPKPVDIKERAFKYSLRAIKLCQYLDKSSGNAGWILSKQYLRSAASIGANLEEAQAAESRADFAHKYTIALKEAREAIYWLKLISESELVPKTKLAPLLKETEELAAIIGKIISNTKRRSR